MTVVALERLLDRHALLRTPRRPLVDRPHDPGAYPGQRIELLDRSIRPVRDERAGVPERAERVRAVQAIGPEPLREVAIRGGVAELHRARDAELGKATDVLRREALRVLDSLAQPERRPHVARRLERIQRRAVRRDHRSRAPRRASRLPRAARTTSASSSPLVITTPEPSSIHAVWEPSVPSMNAFR